MSTAIAYQRRGQQGDVRQAQAGLITSAVAVSWLRLCCSASWDMSCHIHDGLVQGSFPAPSTYAMKFALCGAQFSSQRTVAKTPPLRVRKISASRPP